MRLTGFLAEIEDIAGFNAALAIAADHGGRRVLIPNGKRPLGEESWLVRCVGRPAAEKIVSFYAPHGYLVEVPRGPMRRLLPQFIIPVAERAQSLSAPKLANKSLGELAAHFSVSSRTIRRWRAAARATAAKEKARAPVKFRATHDR